nr:MAG TPA: hypothetical protein [Bacteriophage sp.]
MARIHMMIITITNSTRVKAFLYIIHNHPPPTFYLCCQVLSYI